ncbi:MAG: hypothetical protein JL50_00740 [Peptococcaceae bacterium BICA1-7]|nr:MAG: hypothetical protein JL50_00740 [Peptococcaceae bacterium BICA1-7]HBV98085.1 hypothetical protein [Desulfotomaculum sp.]
MTESMTKSELAALLMANPISGKQEKQRKARHIGVVQLVDVLRLVERQLPIVLNSNIEKEEKEYLIYLTDRALKYRSGVFSNDIGM